MATIKEMEDHCTVTVHDLQQSHREGILKFKHEALEKEEHTHLSFLEACGATLRACPIEVHRVLLYPLQLLMGNILLASLLTAAPQQIPPARETPETPLIAPLPQHLYYHLLPQELGSGTTLLRKRLMDLPLLLKNLLIGSEKKGSHLWGSKKITRRPFIRTLI